jgi:response regulator RpfG family c-di-GMP phosphodiesterase
MIVALGDTLESHFEETGNHVKRISEDDVPFCLLNDGTHQEAEMVKSASSMHDLGKIAIPDAILKKPDRLTEDEFEIIKTIRFTAITILSKSNVNILKIAADIAFYHHEKIRRHRVSDEARGEEIPLYARMMALIDVFDAMTHKRFTRPRAALRRPLNTLRAHGKPFRS